MPRSCATMTLHHALANTSETYRNNRRQIEAFTTTMRRARAARRTQVARIPVVVHVLYNTDAQKLPDEQIHRQIEVLNHDFRKTNEDLQRVPSEFKRFTADAMIEFGLAKRDPSGQPTDGITRRQTPVATFTPDSADPNRQILELDRKIKRVAGGGTAAWPRDRYLNLWVCNMNKDPLGYAQFPGGASETDGVVIDFTAFGVGGTAQAPYNLGRTLTHEIGHWFNLLHIWGDDDQGCGGSDSIEDTPNQAGANFGEPTFPHRTCGNGPNGDMFMNFMDYTDDIAMQMFTAGQVERMGAALSGPRAAVAASDALTPPEHVAAVDLPGFMPFLSATPALMAEEGEQTKRVFDGVQWM
jgi:Pregnancy-associated plasma protein-A